MNPMFDEQISDMFRTMAGTSGALVVCDPLVAKRLVEQGYESKEKLAEWLWKNTMRTAKDYRESSLAYVYTYPLALEGREPYATWYKVPEDTLIPWFPKANNINFVVCGGQTNAFFQVANMNKTQQERVNRQVDVAKADWNGGWECVRFLVR